MATDIKELLSLLKDDDSDISPAFGKSRGIFMPALSQGLGMVDKFGDIINTVRLKELMSSGLDVNSPEFTKKLANINPTVAFSLKGKESETKENTIKNLADNAMLAYRKAFEIDKLPEEQAKAIAQSIWEHGAKFKSIENLPHNLEFEDIRGISSAFGGLTKYGEKAALEQLKSVLESKKVKEAEESDIRVARATEEEKRGTSVLDLMKQKELLGQKHLYKLEELNTASAINKELEALKAKNEKDKQNLIDSRSEKEREVKERQIKVDKEKIVYLESKQNYIREKEKEGELKLPMEKQVKFDTHMLPLKELDGDLNEVERLMDKANNLLVTSGPTDAAAAIGTAYQITAARLRVLENLGVPQAHDMEIINETLKNPTHFINTLRAGGLSAVKSQINQMRKHMYISKQALIDTFGTPESYKQSHELTGEREFAKEFLNQLKEEKSKSKTPQLGSNSQTPPGFKKAKPEYIDYLSKTTKEKGIPLPLVLAIISAESSWNPKSVGQDGRDKGLMQLRTGIGGKPGTAERFGVNDPFDPYENMRGGIDYLNVLFKIFGKNNLEKVISAYNSGEGTVMKKGITNPGYVNTVLAHMKHYEKLGYTG